MTKRCELTGILPLKGHNVSHAKNKTKRRFLPNLKKVIFKIDILKKKKLVSHNMKLGLLPTNKIEDIMKPFATKELMTLSKFLQALKKHKALDQLLALKD